MWGEWRKGWKNVGGECGGGVGKCVEVWGEVECVEKCGGGVGNVLGCRGSSLKRGVGEVRRGGGVKKCGGGVRKCVAGVEEWENMG